MLACRFLRPEGLLFRGSSITNTMPEEEVGVEQNNIHKIVKYMIHVMFFFLLLLKLVDSSQSISPIYTLKPYQIELYQIQA